MRRLKHALHVGDLSNVPRGQPSSDAGCIRKWADCDVVHQKTVVHKRGVVLKSERRGVVGRAENNISSREDILKTSKAY